MPTCRHRSIADRHASRLAGDPHTVSDATALLLVLVAAAGVLTLADLAIIGVLNVIAWLVAR